MTSALLAGYCGSANSACTLAWRTSPIVFASSSVHGPARTVLSLNPVTGLADGLRWSLLGAPAPPAVDLISLATGVAFAVVALVYFQRVERRFADVI